LSLVDGRRFVPANSPSIFGATGNGGAQVDLNSIPTQLIDRVEAVAVGGAPIYGSDAIAGTVNIILKHNYEGLDVDAQGGTSTYGDTNQARVRALAGKNFDDGRGNVELNVEYADLRGLSATQRSQETSDIAYLQPPTPGPYAYQLYNNERLGSISTMGVPMVGDGYLNFNPTVAILNGAGQTLAFNSAGHLTVDYVNISITQAIVWLNPTNVLDACYDDPTYPNAYCNDVTRSANGQITTGHAVWEHGTVPGGQ
jgi:iron complex outermembrane recepter protein